jgi:branched-chain amino acid aminotransferase
VADKLSINGRIVDSADARAEAVSSSRLYGKGIFTTVAILEGEPFLWEKHWRRLSADAARLGVDLSRITEAKVADGLSDLLKANNLANGRARITLSDGSPGTIWAGGEDGRNTSLTIITGPRRQKLEGIKLTVSPHLINTSSPLAGVKSCNYLDPLLAVENAKENGFDEAVRLNERGEVASCCLANIFWSTGDRLFTPGLQTGCLPGTTREFILENLQCEEVEAFEQVLHDADAIFLTSAGIGVVQATEFANRKFGPSAHPILSLLPF